MKIDIIHRLEHSAIDCKFVHFHLFYMDLMLSCVYFCAIQNGMCESAAVYMEVCAPAQLVYCFSKVSTLVSLVGLSYSA